MDKDVKKRGLTRLLQAIRRKLTQLRRLFCTKVGKAFRGGESYLYVPRHISQDELLKLYKNAKQWKRQGYRLRVMNIGQWSEPQGICNRCNDCQALKELQEEYRKQLELVIKIACE